MKMLWHVVGSLRLELLTPLIYCDVYRECELWGYALIPLNQVSGREYPPVFGGYVFIGRQNMVDNIFVCDDKDRVHSTVKHDINQILSHLNSRNLIYSSGADIYK